MRPCERGPVTPVLDLGEEWRIRQRCLDPRSLGVAESLFTLANGYVGWRGTLEEGEPCQLSGTFVNGFHETWPMVHDSAAYGMPDEGQILVEVADAKGFKLFADGARFSPSDAGLESFSRWLDLRAGVLRREVIWRAPGGARLAIRSGRMVSLVRRSLALAWYEVTVLAGNAHVEVVSPVVASESRAKPGPGEQRHPHRTLPPSNVLRPVDHRCRGTRLVLCHRTLGSGWHVACAAEHLVQGSVPVGCRVDAGADAGQVAWAADAGAGDHLEFIKLVSYMTAERVDDPGELCARTELAVTRARDRGRQALVAEQRARLDELWAASQIGLEAAPGHEEGVGEVRQALRLNLFHVWQATACAAGLPAPAKGLTSAAYQGHTLWDSEAYLLPFLTYTAPPLARGLLGFRFRTLDRARARARTLGLPGAAYPWRTINGAEASSFFPAGAAQHHINAAIAYAVGCYIDATGDVGFLAAEGAELLVETARMWTGLGSFSPGQGGGFVIANVTGPDEYAALVDNDFYTNAMARENLRRAAWAVRRLQSADPEAGSRLAEQTGVNEDELAHWERVAAAIVIPYDDDLGVAVQNDGFLDRSAWDFARTPPEAYPLYGTHHPLRLYRCQVLKQPDVVQAMLLLPGAFGAEELRRAFDYYDPLTTADSSLSLSIQAAAALRVGAGDLAWRYLRLAALVDLADVQGSAARGCHLAAMGGSWLAVTAGIAGLDDDGEVLAFTPALPAELAKVSFRLRVRESALAVTLTRAAATYELEAGPGLRLRHRGRDIELTSLRPEIKLDERCE